MVPKDKNGAALPDKTKKNHIPKKVVVYVAKKWPKAKAAASHRGGESKMGSEPLARKTEGPQWLEEAGHAHQDLIIQPGQ